MTAVTIWAARFALGLFAILILCVVGMLFMPWYLFRPAKVPIAAATVVADLSSSPFISPQPVLRPAMHKNSPREALTGPMFNDRDSKVEMKLEGFPFTFVTPSSWGCVAARVGVDAKAWRCIDESAGPNRPELDLVVRHCPGACTEAHRAEVNGEMKYRPTYVAAPDAPTRFLERTVGDRYALTVDRVFARSPGGPLDWLVVIQATARSADIATVQKIVNDIYSQTL